MEWVIAGLGNPGNEYENTRHNIGRDMLISIAKKEGCIAWKEDKKMVIQKTKSFFGKKAQLVLPDTYMNNSGLIFKPFFNSPKDIEKLIVLQDELDLPLGKVRISFGNSSGGHRGIDSIQKTLKTKNFTRIRIGISPTTPSGKLKKPIPAKVVDFVLGSFKPIEKDNLKKVQMIVSKALELIVTENRSSAMTEINSR